MSLKPHRGHFPTVCPFTEEKRISSPKPVLVQIRQVAAYGPRFQSLSLQGF